ncbi:anti-sigma factor [Roseobacter sp. EG26]|uniref:anti-sigma factor n=1 Tax=Roseobacter sp. EG26 TaxID=3412477 RepID=UPI003CE44F07
MNVTDTQDADAAEYVVGLMGHADRIAFTEQLKTEPALVQSVFAWEERLASLNIEYHLASPPDWVKRAIDRRLFGKPGTVGRSTWRSPFLPTLIAAGLAAVLVIFSSQLWPNSPEYVARLEAIETGYSFQASYDQGDQLLTVTPLESQRPENTDFEVWLIGDNGVPLSLGVLPPGGQITLRSDVSIAQGLTLAVSLEPLGGSPTGAPTGPVLSAGILNDV